MKIRKNHINVKVRRRREEKTDYRARIALLKSGLPRLIVRKTNRYIIAQVTKTKEAQDYVICSVNSKELRKYGYNSSFKNIPASYLAGFLLGIKTKGKIKEAILDIGLQESTKGSKIYAVLKGFVDAGIPVRHDPKMLPSEERIKGMHIRKKIEFEKIKIKIEQEAGKAKTRAKPQTLPNKAIKNTNIAKEKGK